MKPGDGFVSGISAKITNRRICDVMSALKTLLKKWELPRSGRSEHETVRRLLRGMSGMPYENLTKILSDDRFRNEEELARDHLKHGTGGTCFSLVSLFLTAARELGLEAEPMLADRSYGPNTHCAAVVHTQRGRVLADPGFLVFRPLRLDGERILELPHTRLRKDEDGKVFTVHPDGHEKFRYQLHEQTVSDDDFRDLWDDSFEWEMMNQLVINCLRNDTHVYLRDCYLHENRREASEQQELERDEIVDRIDDLGIDPAIARAAMSELDLSPRSSGSK